jgi:hypothetical protein
MMGNSGQVDLDRGDMPFPEEGQFRFFTGMPDCHFDQEHGVSSMHDYIGPHVWHSHFDADPLIAKRLRATQSLLFITKAGDERRQNKGTMVTKNLLGKLVQSCLESADALAIRVVPEVVALLGALVCD